MSNKITVTGKCCHVSKVQTFASGFTKRDFAIVDDSGTYPSHLAFTLKKDKTELVSEKDLQKTLTVTGYVESREWTDPKTNAVKYFTDVTAVKVERDASAGTKETVPEPAQPTDDVVAEAEDLPF